MKKIKEIKIVNQDESTEVANIGADAINVDYNDTTVKAELDKLNVTDNSLKNTQTNQGNLLNSLQSQVQSLASGSPKGSYANAAAIVSANPDTGVYVAQDNGHVYSWTKNGSNVIDLGVYQATVEDKYYTIYNNYIKPQNLSITSLRPEILKNLYLKWGTTIEIMDNDTAGVVLEDNCYYKIDSNLDTDTYSVLKRTSSNDYSAYKYNLTEGITYEFDGEDFYEVRGLIIIDTLNNNKVIFSSKHSNSTIEFQNLVFTADRTGLMAIMSIKKSIFDEKSAGRGERWFGAPKLRPLVAIEQELKSKEPELLWIWNNCYTEHTDSTVKLGYSSDNSYITYVYELKHDYTYIVKGYNYGVVDLCTIINKKKSIKYEDSWIEHTGYSYHRSKDVEYTPAEDCYLLLSRYVNTEEEHYEYLRKNRYSFYIKQFLENDNENSNFISLNTLKNLKVKTYITLDPVIVAEEIINYGYINMDYRQDIGEFLDNPSTIEGYGDYIIPVKPGEVYTFKTKHSYMGTAWGICSKEKILLRAAELPNTGVGSNKMIEETIVIQPGEYYLVISSKDFEYLRKVTSFNIGNSILRNLKICYDGDSLTESRLSGTAANGGGYAKLIADKVGGTYENQAVGGGTLTSQEAVGGTRHSVYDNLENLPTDADIYVFSGGINDYWQGQTLGEITTGYTDEINPGTICGALEGIFRYAIDNFLGKPILFVITHKVSQTHLTPNSKGYTFQDVVDKIIAICKKYAIPYYNAFDESGVNGGISSQNLEFMTAGSSGSPDGCHINEKGYGKYYVPQIIQKLESMVNLDYLNI